MQGYATEIRNGFKVLGSDQGSIGDVAEVGQKYLLVQKGMFFPKDLYIPLDYVAAVEPEGYVRLTIPKNEVDSMGWETMAEDDGNGAWSGRAPERSTEPRYDDQARLTRSEEQLRAQTRPEQAGEVRVGKDVVEERQEFDVPVSREEVEVRRVPVDRPATADDTAFVDDGDTIRVPLTAERVEVTKDARVVEELEIDKRKVTDTARVGDTVRKEQFRVEREGDVRGATEDLDKR